MAHRLPPDCFTIDPQIKIACGAHSLISATPKRQIPTEVHSLVAWPDERMLRSGRIHLCTHTPVGSELARKLISESHAAIEVVSCEAAGSLSRIARQPSPGRVSESKYSSTKHDGVLDDQPARSR